MPQPNTPPYIVEAIRDLQFEYRRRHGGEHAKYILIHVEDFKVFCNELSAPTSGISMAVFMQKMEFYGAKVIRSYDQQIEVGKFVVCG